MLIKFIHYQSLDPKYYHSRPEGLNEYVLVLAHTPAYFHSEEKKYLLRESQIFIYDKGSSQLMYSTDGVFIHDWFHFDMDISEREKFLALNIPLGEPISAREPAILSEYIRMIAVEFNSGSTHSARIIDSLLNSFFMKLSDQIHTPQDPLCHNSEYYRELNDLRSDMRTFPYHDWTLERVSSTVNMSKTWFQHHYKKIFGVSFYKDLIDFRIDYAKRVLLRNDYPINYVAELCGYKSDVYFMRQFKEKTGFTPSEYRFQCRQNHQWQKDCPSPDTNGAP